MFKHIVVYRARRGVLLRNQYGARVVAGNGRVLWRLSESYSNKQDVIDRCMTDFPMLTIDDQTGD